MVDVALGATREIIALRDVKGWGMFLLYSDGEKVSERTQCTVFEFFICGIGEDSEAKPAIRISWWVRHPPFPVATNKPNSKRITFAGFLQAKDN